MSNLTVFNFENHKVRIEFLNSEPWFCLIDICKIFGLQNSSMIKDRLDKSYLNKIEVATPYGKKEALFVAEPNLYEVIFCSNKPEAKRFKKWVFEEVLPQIRKTGSYGQKSLSAPVPQSSPRWVTGWEIDGLHDFIRDIAKDHLPYYGTEAENAIVMRIKYELNISTFERETTITQDLFDKAFDIARKIFYAAKKFSDQAQRNEQCFIKDNIKGIAIKL